MHSPNVSRANISRSYIKHKRPSSGQDNDWKSLLNDNSMTMDEKQKAI